MRTTLNRKIRSTVNDSTYQTYAEAFSSRISGRDYDLSEIREVIDTIDNQSKVLGNLIDLLIAKGIVTDNEVEDNIVKGIVSHWDKNNIKPQTARQIRSFMTKNYQACETAEELADMSIKFFGFDVDSAEAVYCCHLAALDFI